MLVKKITIFKLLFICAFLCAPALADDIAIGLFDDLKFRHVGPEGNRTIAAAGIPGDPQTYYVGAASGGLWKTDDAGLTWKPVFDDQDVSSVGAVAVSRSNSNIVWVGSGETNVRSSISIGNGVYKSTDAGDTWQHMGLTKSARVGRIVIHPDNPDIVYVAAMGTAYGPQEERGIFKSTDGGEGWERVLFTDPGTGGIEITMHPDDPDTIIAGMWPIHIRTWGRHSGGPNGGLYKTQNGGQSWKKLSDGLPEGDVGNVSVSYAPSDPSIVYALIETDQTRFDGVLWRSDDGGEKWRLVSYDQEYMTRPHYYTRIVVAPDNPEEIYTLASNLSVSKDGGLTSTSHRELGGDEHDLWIDPENPNRMIGANDQTVRISTNRGKSWLFTALPIAQMYHVSVDDQVPYFLYGNRQDGPTYRIPSSTTAGKKTINIGGGEAGFTYPDPFDNSIVWASNEQGVLDRYDLKAGQARNVQVWPETPVGRSPGDIKYRWIWSFPFIPSQHIQNTLYAGSQFVHKTTDGGENWVAISPDLTLNDPDMQIHSGGLTVENVGVDYGNTLYALAESPLDADVLWAGSNDGLIHVTGDGGDNWNNVTGNLPGLPPLGTVTSIDASRFDKGTAYVSFDLHQVDDRNTYLFKTDDYGASWTKITDGIPQTQLGYAQVIREDLVRQGLLYAGTENALYVSFDDGEHWQKFDNGLPPAPYRWIALQEAYGDLVAGTYGRGYWILDDLTGLREVSEDILERDSHLFTMRKTYRLPDSELAGQTSFHTATFHTDYLEDLEYGLPITYYLSEDHEGDVSFTVRDDQGNLVAGFSGVGEKGVNREFWNLRFDDSPPIKLLTAPPKYSDAAREWFKGENNDEGWRELRVEGSGPNGPIVSPGQYFIEMKTSTTTHTEPVDVLKDPKSPANLKGIRAQTELALEIRAQVNVLTEMANRIERIRFQIESLKNDVEMSEELQNSLGRLESSFVSLEGQLYILNTTGASENLLRYPSQLFSHLKMLGYYVMSGDSRPTHSKYEVFDVLSGRLEQISTKYEQLLSSDVPGVNRQLAAGGYQEIERNLGE
jgi:photosystem II stability/assembly factor-like uncharacterized protein